MLKRIAVLLAVVVTVMSLSSTALAHHKPDHQGGPPNQVVVLPDLVVSYDHFCHRSNSVTNPWQNKPFSSPYSEVNGNGNNDHTQHDGPIPVNANEAQDLKNAKIKWGDIIPPVPPLPNGMNWTAAGQAIWANGCNYTTPVPDEPLVTFDVSCQVIGNELKNVVTLTNEGLASGSAFVNGVEVVLAPSEVKTVEVNPGVNIEVVIEGNTVYDATPVCENGRGAGDPEVTASSDPADPQVEAPKAGVNAGGGAVIGTLAALTGSLGSLGYGVQRLRKTRA